MIAITGGGTGGHLAIARALGRELNLRGLKAIFIGSSSGQDRMWFEDSDIFEACYFLDSSGVVNKRGFGKVLSLVNILNLAFKCKHIFDTHGRIRQTCENSLQKFCHGSQNISCHHFFHKLFQ